MLTLKGVGEVATERKVEVVLRKQPQQLVVQPLLYNNRQNVDETSAARSNWQQALRVTCHIGQNGAETEPDK